MGWEIEVASSKSAPVTVTLSPCVLTPVIDKSCTRGTRNGSHQANESASMPKSKDVVVAINIDQKIIIALARSIAVVFEGGVLNVIDVV